MLKRVILQSANQLKELLSFLPVEPDQVQQLNNAIESIDDCIVKALAASSENPKG